MGDARCIAEAGNSPFDECTSIVAQLKGAIVRDNSRCVAGGETTPNGNCTIVDPADGVAVQCVGGWAKDKHDYLDRYIKATRAVRAQFLNAGRTQTAGGAAFIDLFAGPGRARIFSNGLLIDGSPLIALKHESAPFSRVILCDTDAENISALRKRTEAHAQRVTIVDGDCRKNIDKIIALIPPYGLNLTLYDPFSLDSLSFPTLEKLASFQRMDLIVHFPTMDAKRNHAKGALKKLENATGSTDMASVVRKPSDTMKAIQKLRMNLGKLGYTGYDTTSIPIKNTSNATLYHLAYFSKSEKGDDIWNSIACTTAAGQRSLFGA
jgi:three-Cys-motif partner protein